MKDDAFKALQELSVIALGEGTEAQSVYTRQLTDTIRAALTPSPVSVDAKAGDAQSPDTDEEEHRLVMLVKSSRLARGYDNITNAKFTAGVVTAIRVLRDNGFLKALTAPKPDSKPVSGEVAYPVECKWPSAEKFFWRDDEPENAHSTVYVFMPCGGGLPLNHYNDATTDPARAQWIVDACNAYARKK